MSANTPPCLEAEGVRHFALFGSVARGDDVPESDVDLILDLDPKRQIGLFAFAGRRSWDGMSISARRIVFDPSATGQ